jgi:hypothetical protein
MSIHPARIVAALALLAGGFVVAVSVLAIAFAQILVDAGLVVRPADAALLSDLVPVLPFVGGFAIASILAGVGLLLGATAAETLAVGTSVVAITAGLIGIALVVVGRDPFAGAGTGSPSDGVGIIAAFTVTYITAVVALAVARPRTTASTQEVPS